MASCEHERTRIYFSSHSPFFSNVFFVPEYNPLAESPIINPTIIPAFKFVGYTYKVPAATPKINEESGRNLFGRPAFFKTSTSPTIKIERASCRQIGIISKLKKGVKNN